MRYAVLAQPDAYAYCEALRTSLWACSLLYYRRNGDDPSHGLMGLASAALGSLGLDVLKVNAETGFPAQEEFARVGNAQGTLLIGDRCLGYMLGADAASAGIALGDAWRARALFPEDGLSHVLTSVSYGQYLEVLACASDASLTALQGCRTPYALGYILPLDIYCPLDGCGS